MRLCEVFMINGIVIDKFLHNFTNNSLKKDILNFEMLMVCRRYSIETKVSISLKKIDDIFNILDKIFFAPQIEAILLPKYYFNNYIQMLKFEFEFSKLFKFDLYFFAFEDVILTNYNAIEINNLYLHSALKIIDERINQSYDVVEKEDFLYDIIIKEGVSFMKHKREFLFNEYIFRNVTDSLKCVAVIFPNDSEENQMNIINEYAGKNKIEILNIIKIEKIDKFKDNLFKQIKFLHKNGILFNAVIFSSIDLLKDFNNNPIDLLEFEYSLYSKYRLWFISIIETIDTSLEDTFQIFIMNNCFKLIRKRISLFDTMKGNDFVSQLKNNGDILF